MHFVFGDCALDTEAHELRRAGQVAPLELRAFRVLAHLLRHARQAVSKQDLVQACWPVPSSDAVSQEYALRNCVLKIRRAVGDTGTRKAVIETVRGYGYRVTAEVTVLPPDAPAAASLSQAKVNNHQQPPPNPLARALPERRQLTVLSCAMAEEPAWARQDPENMKMLLQAFYTACEDVVQPLNGYIAQYDNAGLLIYFGYPTADETAAARAVRAGLALVDALTRLQVLELADTPLQLGIRLGIHTGLVVVDASSSERRHEPIALGDTPKVATRLQERAAANTVVVSDATWRLVQGYFTGQMLESAALSDVGAPIQAHRILDVSGAQSRLDSIPTWQLTPLVGREAELTLLQDRWIQARDGLGQVVVLSGEPGIGKSRLLQAFRRRLADEPHARLEWRCAPDAQQSPFQPVIAHWRQRLSQCLEDGAEDQLRALEAALAAYDFALPEATPLFASLLSLPAPAHYPPLALTPRQQRQKTLESLRAWLLAEAARQPILLMVEDLHWSDPSTLEFLTLLIDQGPIANMLALLTCRPEFEAPWSFRAHCTPLTLPCLSRTQAIEMIGRVAGGHYLSPEVVAQIAAKTDGVPLFIEELTKTVLESDMLRAGVDSGVRPEPLLALAIPITLHDSLMARLDRLGPVKEVAQLGATIGREFAHDVLQSVADMSEVALQQGLRQLVAVELLYQQGVPPQATYTFKHALVHDVAAQSLLRGDRQHYHRRIAQVIKTQFADIAETQPELLAHHYAAAGLPAHALPYYRRAAENAVARSAHREAVTLFERALETTQHLPDGRDTTEQAIDLRLALRMALRPLGEFERILAYLREAEVLAEAIDDAHRLAQITGFMAIHFRLTGAYDQGVAAGQRSLVHAQASGDMGLCALANQHLGNVYEGKSDYRRAIGFFENTVASLPGAKQHERYGQIFLPAVQSRAWLSTCHAELGMFSKGVRFGAEGLKIAEAFNHPASRMIALFGMGQLFLRQGDLSQALPLLERSMSVCRDADLLSYFSLMATGLGGAWTMVGRAADAVSLLTQAQEPDMPGSHLRCLIALSEAYLAAGQRAEAYASVEQALTFAQMSKSRGLQAYARRLLGDIAMHTDSPSLKQVAAHYQQALALAEALGMRPLQAHCHRALGDLYHQAGHIEQAHAALSKAAGMYREMEMTFWLSAIEVGE